MEPQHPLLTSLHPQLVAAKSLIFNSSRILLTLHNMWEAWKCYRVFEKDFLNLEEDVSRHLTNTCIIVYNYSMYKMSNIYAGKAKSHSRFGRNLI